MYEKSPVKLTLDLNLSWALSALLVAVHGGAFAIAMFAPMPITLRVALAVLVLASLYRALMWHAWRRASGAVVAVALEEDGACALRRRNANAWEEGRLVDCWVHPLLTIVVVRSDGGRWSTGVAIAADAVAAESFRRLRVRLRLRSAAA